MGFADFESRIRQQFPEDWQQFLSCLENEPATSIRWNQRKNLSHPKNPIPWASHGEYLDHRPAFTFDPSFHLGRYYVQESSSMFIDYVLKKVKKELSLDRVLDLCAAPGGKSTLALDHLDSDQFLIANEMIPQRNIVLRENMTKWGYPNFLITENKPADFKALTRYFDCILLDAPCSGEGLFRKDKNARKEWSLGIANMCSERQYDIFKSIWPCLKEGGVLIYSTCTFNPAENELLLEKLLDDGFEFETVDIELPSPWDIDIVKTKRIMGYRFLPHKVKGEGFFCSILRKKGFYTKHDFKASKNHINPWLSRHLSLEKLIGYSTYKFKNSLFLAPSRLLDELTTLSKNLYLKQIGIEVALFKGLEIEPQQGLVLLNHQMHGFPIHPLSLEEAIAYLSHDNLNAHLSSGFHLMMHDTLMLGLARMEKDKLLNFYPSGWKIRTKKPS